jgi:alkylation response protein AidB-like acyl-CoA dehydrogenase
MAVTRTAVDSAVDAIVALVESAGPQAQQAALYGYAAGEARAAVLSALQVHGGIGFTAEYPLHAYLKRVLRLQAIAGEGEPLLALGKQLLAGA